MGNIQDAKVTDMETTPPRVSHHPHIPENFRSGGRAPAWRKALHSLHGYVNDTQSTAVEMRARAQTIRARLLQFGIITSSPTSLPKTRLIAWLTSVDGFDPYSYEGVPPIGVWEVDDPIPPGLQTISDEAQMRGAYRTLFRVQHNFITKESSLLELMIYAIVNNIQVSRNISTSTVRGVLAPLFKSGSEVRYREDCVFPALLSGKPMAVFESVVARLEGKLPSEAPSALEPIELPREPVAPSAPLLLTSTATEEKTESKDDDIYHRFCMGLLSATTTDDLLTCMSIGLERGAPIDKIIELSRARRDSTTELWTPEVARAFGELLRKLKPPPPSGAV